MSEFLSNSYRDEINSKQEPIQGHPMGNSFESDLADDLVNDFTDWYIFANDEDFDEATLDAFLEELQSETPLDIPFDWQGSLERFYNKFSPLFTARNKCQTQHNTEKKHHHRWFMRIAILAAIITGIFASMITAQALGIDVFGFFAQWTDEIFFYTNEKESIQEQNLFQKDEDIKFESIEAALMAFDIDFPIIPNWYPDGINDFAVTGRVTDLGVEIFALSTNEEENLTIVYSEFNKQNGPTRVIEKDDTKVFLYHKDACDHYVVTDNELCTATWIVGNIHCMIFGFISQNEMIRIIDSMYEVI